MIYVELRTNNFEYNYPLSAKTQITFGPNMWFIYSLLYTNYTISKLFFCCWLTFLASAWQKSANEKVLFLSCTLSLLIRLKAITVQSARLWPVRIKCLTSGSGHITLTLLTIRCRHFHNTITRKPHNLTVTISPIPRDYHYVDMAKMEKLKAAGEFLENATFSGNMYGTSKVIIFLIKSLVNLGS